MMNAGVVQWMYRLHRDDTGGSDSSLQECVCACGFSMEKWCSSCHLRTHVCVCK